LAPMCAAGRRVAGQTRGGAESSRLLTWGWGEVRKVGR
jgi:hypothetical protein